MEDQCLRCNNRTENGGICRKELKQSAVVTTCSHVLCKECAERTGFMGTHTKDRQCPVCTQPLPNVDDAAETNLRPTEEYRLSVLCGLDPTTIMECASSALSFWNYQMLQETAYQQHLLLALGKKYGNLNGEADKLVEEANTEIGSLHQTIEDISQDNQKLQQKNLELADNCRERGKKYIELRKGYEVLKKIVQHFKQNQTNEEVAEQAIQNFTSNPLPEAASGTMKSRQLHDDAGTDQPNGRHFPRTRHNYVELEQLRRNQRGSNGSHYSGEFAGVRQPGAAFRHGTTKLQGNEAFPNRTPLPGVFREAADRSQHASTSHDNSQNLFVPTGSSHRYSLRSNTKRSPDKARPSTSSDHSGGISSGMKIGSVNYDGHSKDHNSYIPTRGHNFCQN